MYFFGEGSLEVNEGKAVEYFKKAAEKDEPRALYALGGCYKDGIEVEEDQEKSLYYYKKSAENGYVKAFNYLFGVFQEEKNTTEMLKYLKMGADFGHATSIYNFGFAYLGNMGMTENLQESFKYFMRAANLGHNLAQHKVGYAYFNGIGVECSWFFLFCSFRSFPLFTSKEPYPKK